MANDPKQRPSNNPDDDEHKPLFGGAHQEQANHGQQGVYDNKFDAMRASGALSADPEARQLSPEQLEEHEEAALAGQSDQQFEYNDADGGGFSDRLRGRLKGKVTRRKAIAGGLTGLLVGGAFGIFSIVQGPAQIVHFAQLLQKFHFTNNEDFMDGRAGRYLRHMFSGSAEQARLGRAANRIATASEKRLNSRAGVRSIYSDPPNRRLIGYEVIDANKADSLIKQLDADGVDTNGQRRGTGVDGKAPTGRYIDIDIGSSNKDIRYRRTVTKTVVKSANLGKVAGPLSSRLLIVRGGVDFHPLKNKKRQAGEKLVDYYNDRKKERSERRKHGVNAPDGRLRGSEADTDGDGKPDQGQGSSDSAQKGNEFAEEAKKNGGTPEGRKAMVGKIVGGGAIVGVAQALCVVNDTGNNIDEFHYQNQLIMMRMGIDINATGNQIMAPITPKEGKDVNLDEVGSVDDDLYDDEKKTSWASARSIQAELGQEQTGPDFPKDSKPGREKPDFFKAVAAIPFINGGCGLADQAKKIPIVGPMINLAESTAEAGINGVLGQFGYSIEEFRDSVIRFFAGEAVNTYAKGAELGNIANYGVRLAANDQAIAAGGRALSATDIATLDEAAHSDYRREFASRSFFDRVLDPYNVDSVAGAGLLRLPKTPDQAFASLLRMPSNLFSSLARFAAAPVTAQTAQPYDYGFPEFGFSLEEQEDERFENPFENAAIVEPRLAELNDKYGDCFSMRVDPATGNLQSGQAKRYDEIEKKPECRDGSEDLARYRFYLADATTAHSLACYEGIEESCNQVGFGDTAGMASPSAASEQIVGDPYTDSSSVACATGTQDIGLNEGYSDGRKFTVRLCSLPNLPSSGQADNPGSKYSTPGASGFAIVNSRVSGAWFKLINDARNAGLHPSVGSSFRSMPHQQSLFAANPNPSLVARPGYSSHQAGVALDFSGMGTKGGDTCATRATAPYSPAWRWLRDNAGNYGFKQYAKEAWHWDALPAANRCG